MFKEGVDEYIRDHPNIWDSIFLFRCEEIDPNNELVTYRLAVRSAFLWQVSNRVLRHRGELHQFCVALSFKLHINYDKPNKRSVMYYGGSLVNGGVQDYKACVLKNSNINNNNDEILAGPISKSNIFATRSREDGRSIIDSKMRAPCVVATSQNKSQNQGESLTKENDRELSPINESILNEEDKSFLSMLQDSHM